MYPPVYIPYKTPPLLCAEKHLTENGVPIVCNPDEAEYILYPTPTALTALADYMPDCTIIGGNLDFLNPAVRRIDLLKDPHYLASNAAITAEATLGLMISGMPDVITEASVLIIGWGRIGKCLAHQLRLLNVNPIVYARKPEDRAMLSALGFQTLSADQLTTQLPVFTCIVNTAPAAVLQEYDARLIRPDCFKIDLASVLSIPGEGVNHARGLPGKYKPEASGALIAQTILKYF